MDPKDIIVELINTLHKEFEKDAPIIGAEIICKKSHAAKQLINMGEAVFPHLLAFLRTLKRTPKTKSDNVQNAWMHIGVMIIDKHNINIRTVFSGNFERFIMCLDECIRLHNLDHGVYT